MKPYPILSLSLSLSLSLCYYYIRLLLYTSCQYDCGHFHAHVTALVTALALFYLSHRFRVLLTVMLLKHQHVEAVVMAACVLHNVLRGRSPSLTDGDAEDPET